MKIAVAAVAAIIAVPIFIGGIGKAIVSALFGTGGTEPSQAAIAEIPSDYLSLYRAAASVCPGLDWTILAAIGDAESKHGRGSGQGIKQGENHMGAGGPMQFLKPTFDGVIARHTIPPGGSNPPSRYNPHDAIYAAAFYLCDSGAQKNIRKALYAYNHSESYVNSVLAQAKRYGTATVGTGDCDNIQAPSPAAIMAINFACGQLGLPYVWGGNGPDAGHDGFDCSGLTTAAYKAAGITLPRTAHTQFHAGPRVPHDQPLLPGDLVFYGNPNTKIHHVGLYIGGGLMINAPRRGQPVQIDNYRYNGDKYAGATRPASTTN
jgi:cell wall-associated NlpC family hydrolase